MSESKAKKIEIKDVDGRTLSKLIDYIYTAEIEVTEENVQVNSAPAKSSVYRTLRAHCFIASFHLTLAACSGSHGQLVGKRPSDSRLPDRSTHALHHVAVIPRNELGTQNRKSSTHVGSKSW